MFVDTDFKITPCGTLRPTLAGLTPGPSLSVNSGYSRSTTSTFPGPMYATPRLPGIGPPPLRLAYPGDFRGHVPTLPGHVGGAPFFAATSDPGLQQKAGGSEGQHPAEQQRRLRHRVWVKTPTREAF